jgi:ribosomal protein L30E
MTRIQVSAIALAFTTFLTGHAMAASDAPVTRAQVQAELAEAIRTGNIIVGESGDRLNEIFVHNYPAQQAAPSVTRAQVQAELAEAIRTGNVVVGESSAKLNEIMPNNYAAGRNVISKSRAQVQSELAEAIASGELRRHIEA